MTVDSLSLDEQALLTAGRDMWTTLPYPQAGIPSVRMADGPMGIASGRVDERDVSVLTPSGVALGATWDVDLVARVAALVGGDAKRQGVDLVLAPNVNLPRSPLAGRAFELFSEDPLLTGTIGVAWIGGLQSRNVGAVAKHLVCNDSETERDRYDAHIGEAALHEAYLLPFEMAADAGCAGLLMAYNAVNGHYCAEHRGLITDIIKQEWRFAGFTVSDWFGTHSTAGSATAGLDLEMPGPARFMGGKLAAMIDAGTLDPRSITESAGRTARAAQRWRAPDLGQDEDRDTLLAEAAAAGFTLLRNEGRMLPLGDSVGMIAVIGPNAAHPCYQGGTFAKIAIRPDAMTPVEAIRARFGTERVRYEPGVSPSYRLPPLPVTPARDLGDGAVQGMTIDYFDGGDAPFHSDTRDTNSLTWFAGMHKEARFATPGTIRASGWYTPERSGSHRFVIGATGAYSLHIDGREVHRCERTIPASDIMGALKGGDGDTIAIELAGGKPVLVEAELRFQPARAHGLWYGVHPPEEKEAMWDRALAAARESDAVVLVLGETADSGVESKDRDTTKLAEEQLRLAEAVCAANPNVAIVVNVGHAFDPAFADPARAFLIAWYPGEAFGPALADVLAGEREPSGRLPVTLAARDEDYPVLGLAPDEDGTLVYGEGTAVGYRHFARNAIAPRYALGAGLGYGDFDYLGMTIEGNGEGVPLIRVRVANRAGRDAAEVVQVYRDDERFALIGFAKALIPAGGESEIAIRPDLRMFRIRVDGSWVRETGTFRLAIGRSAVDCRLAMHLNLN
jgi:beta-glucosidase